ncbi:MAG: alpha/beta fold hydrolase [Burkholderiales bacterium]
MHGEKIHIDGPVGKLEVVVNDPGPSRRAIALVAHPHPLYGGTLDNKVAQTLAKTFFELNCVALRPNFRGVGGSEGQYDQGRGEVDDMLAVHAYAKKQFGDLPVYSAGFSFGGFVASEVLKKLKIKQLVMIAPAVGTFTLGDVPKNTIVIHGEQDETVPYQHILDWARPQDLAVITIPGADHFFHRRLHHIKDFVTRLCQF